MADERVCIEPGCNEPAGTPWGPHWCEKHDQERRDRITKQLRELAGKGSDDG